MILPYPWRLYQLLPAKEAELRLNGGNHYYTPSAKEFDHTVYH
jgi:hypothetical protein